MGKTPAMQPRLASDLELNSIHLLISEIICVYYHDCLKFSICLKAAFHCVDDPYFLYPSTHIEA